MRTTPFLALVGLGAVATACAWWSQAHESAPTAPTIVQAQLSSAPEQPPDQAPARTPDASPDVTPVSDPSWMAEAAATAAELRFVQRVAEEKADFEDYGVLSTVRTFGPLGPEAKHEVVSDLQDLIIQAEAEAQALASAPPPPADGPSVDEQRYAADREVALLREKLRSVMTDRYWSVAAETSMRDYTRLSNRLSEDYHLAMMAPERDQGLDKCAIVYIPRRGNLAIDRLSDQVRFHLGVRLRSVCAEFNALPFETRREVLTGDRDAGFAVGDRVLTFPKGLRANLQLWQVEVRPLELVDVF